MKKTLILSLAIIISVLAMYSCHKNIAPITGKNTVSGNTHKYGGRRGDTRISFDDAGRYHNILLGYVCNNLTPRPNQSYASLENTAQNLVLAYLAIDTIPEDTSDVEEGFALNIANFPSTNQGFNTFDYVAFANQQIQSQANIGFLSPQEQSEIIGLVSFLDNCKRNNVSAADMISGINSRKNDWLAANHKTDNGDGVVSGYCIYIAQYSAQLWTTYAQDPNWNNNNTNPVCCPAFVVADVCGAIGGAIGAGVDSYAHTGKVDWVSVGAWALGSAVGASCLGPVGKALSWLFG